jgi:hypothetical protein
MRETTTLPHLWIRRTMLRTLYPSYLGPTALFHSETCWTPLRKVLEPRLWRSSRVRLKREQGIFSRGRSYRWTWLISSFHCAYRSGHLNDGQ